MTKILALLMLMIPFLSNAAPVFDPALIELHKGFMHQCKINYRPITREEALTHESYIKSKMGFYQITSIENPYKISGLGYNNYLEEGSANETYCYPQKSISNPVLIELHKGFMHQCKIDYRPITRDEALKYEDYIRKNMSFYQITSIERPYKLTGNGYENYLEEGSANETYCYPDAPISNSGEEIADSELFIPSLVEKFMGTTHCPDDYRVPTEFEVSENLNAFDRVFDNGTHAALEYPWILVNSNARILVEQGTSDDLLCYPKMKNAVVLYENENHDGRAFHIRRDNPNLGKNEFLDKMSSFVLPKGMTVRFYSGLNYEGRYFTRSDSERVLHEDMNDKIRSVKILPKTTN